MSLKETNNLNVYKIVYKFIVCLDKMYMNTRQTARLYLNHSFDVMLIYDSYVLNSNDFLCARTMQSNESSVQYITFHLGGLGL